MTQVARPAPGMPRRLDAFELPSQPGNERLALARVAQSVASLGLSPARLDKLKTAVAEATMNAIEHGNDSRPELPVRVEVLQVTARPDVVSDSVVVPALPEMAPPGDTLKVVAVVANDDVALTTTKAAVSSVNRPALAGLRIVPDPP